MSRLLPPAAFLKTFLLAGAFFVSIAQPQAGSTEKSVNCAGKSHLFEVAKALHPHMDVEQSGFYRSVAEATDKAFETRCRHGQPMPVLLSNVNADCRATCEFAAGQKYYNVIFFREKKTLALANECDEACNIAEILGRDHVNGAPTEAITSETVKHVRDEIAEDRAEIGPARSGVGK